MKENKSPSFIRFDIDKNMTELKLVAFDPDSGMNIQ